MEEKPLSKETFDTKKPIQSPPALFLSYTIDLLFASLVFIVVLLVTWGLHNLGNILGMGWFRFSWRIFEMSFISFGTLLCVLFFLRASFGFARKLIPQLQKPIKQVGGKPSGLQPWDVARRFGEPLHRQHLGLFVFSVVIIVAFLYVGISFTELSYL